MKRRYLLMLAFMASTAVMQAAGNLRTVENLNFGWRFHNGDGTFETVATDDSAWRTVDVPHDFQIEQPWVPPTADEKADNNDPAANIKSRLSSRGFKEMGIGWYRRHLNIPDSLKGKRLLLQFDGIMYTADVYLNGNRIGGTDYGYVGFEIDVTGLLKTGADNVLAVRADTRQPNNSRWYTGGGLFRDVRLVATDRDLYFERYPLYITTRDNRYVNVTVEVVTRGRDKKMPVELKVVAPDGSTVYQGRSTVSRSTPTRSVEQQLPEIEIPNPKLWDTETPNLYTIEATLFNEKGQAVDFATDHFGLRTIEITPTEGLKLNGKKTLLKGYANHHTLGALGAAAYPRAIEKRILMMKQWGINHIRTSHNPYSRQFIELCDKHGILVVDELYDKWTRQHTGGRVPFEALWQKDIPEWIKRDRNSPSVVMWSLGNELQQDPNQPYNDWGVTMYRLQKTLLQRYDTTRLVTVAMHPRYRNWQTDSLPCDLAMITDVQSYNYRYMYFPGDGRRFPWMKFYQSEASVAAMGQNYFEMDLDRVIGLAYWGAIDYLGESQGWPAKGWSQGVFDIALEPKPKAWYMKSFFCPDEPTVHIGIVDKKGDQMWNGVQTGNDGMSDHWQRVHGKKLSLYTYTNAEEVELLLNGKSLGRKANPTADAKHRNQIRWDDIEYQPGYLEAVAYNGGRAIARHRIETTGDAVALKAEPDLAMNKKTNNNKLANSTSGGTTWLADGTDLQHVRIVAVDKKGRRVQTAAAKVNFAVEGDARIVGVINGDINSHELTVGNTRSLYNGSCTVILRAGRTPGKVTLTATAPDMKAATITMQTY